MFSKIFPNFIKRSLKEKYTNRRRRFYFLNIFTLFKKLCLYRKRVNVYKIYTQISSESISIRPEIIYLIKRNEIIFLWNKYT